MCSVPAVTDVPSESEGESEDLAAASDSVDPQVLFSLVWDRMERKRGPAGMVFPKEMIFFCGAPGAGKGTMGGIIMQERDFAAGPLEVSALLQAPRFAELKDKGLLVGDKDVIEAMLEELLDPKYAEGVVIDGFPRTATQAAMIKNLADSMKHIRHRHKDHPTLANAFPRPHIHIAVLYVDAEESVKRQLARGEKLAKHNERVSSTGIGKHMEKRATDHDVALARRRYEVFQEQIFAALNTLRDVFSFHFIDANGPPEEVAARIQEEFKYQSSMELNNDCFDMVRQAAPPAREIIKHARQRMVARLNAYATDHTEMFQQALDLIRHDFVHILQRQALAGTAIIRSNSPILEHKLAVNMVLDVLAERGYVVALDIVRDRFPDRVEPAVPGDFSGQPVHNTVLKTWIFTVHFKRPQIRRADD